MYIGFGGDAGHPRTPVEAERGLRGPRVVVPVPGLHRAQGLGDVVKRLTSAVGIEPCGGCQQRAEKLNRAVRFSPWET